MQEAARGQGVSDADYATVNISSPPYDKSLTHPLSGAGHFLLSRKLENPRILQALFHIFLDQTESGSQDKRCVHRDTPLDLALMNYRCLLTEECWRLEIVTHHVVYVTDLKCNFKDCKTREEHFIY